MHVHVQAHTYTLQKTCFDSELSLLNQRHDKDNQVSEQMVMQEHGGMFQHDNARPHVVHLIASLLHCCQAVIRVPGGHKRY